MGPLKMHFLNILLFQHEVLRQDYFSILLKDNVKVPDF